MPGDAGHPRHDILVPERGVESFREYRDVERLPVTVDQNHRDGVVVLHFQRVQVRLQLRLMMAGRRVLVLDGAGGLDFGDGEWRPIK